MHANLNAKQKTLGLFLSIKPTVIDKLISKNKSSIIELQTESSEESRSADSEGSMGSESTDTNQQPQTRKSLQTTKMAPKKQLKQKVVGNKINKKLLGSTVGIPVPFKRKVGRPKKINNDNPVEVPKASKKFIKQKLNIAKRIVRGKIAEVKNNDVTPTKLKKKIVSKENEPLTNDKSVNIQKKRNSVQKTKLSLSPEKTATDDSGKKELSPKKHSPEPSRALGLLNASKTIGIKKLPSLDRWKNGIPARGRGRPRGGGLLRGTLKHRGRGGFKGRGIGRGAHYLTRSDSPIPILRNGKRRKCSDPANIEELNLGRKRRCLNSDIMNKSEDFSDEQCSVVADSEFSYSESVNTPLGVEDREIKTEINNCDLDVATVPDNKTDTNSNLFKSGMRGIITKTEDCTNSDNKIIIDVKKDEDKLKNNDNKSLFLPEPLLRDSDGSFDSDATEDSTSISKSKFRQKNRKRITDGLWVRRSTRSINVKESENDAPVIKEFCDNKNDVTKHTINTDFYMNTAKSTNIPQVLSSSNDAIEPNADFTLRLEESPEKEDEINVIKSNKQRNLNASDIRKETSGLNIEEKSDFSKTDDNEIVIPPIDVKMKNTRLPKKLDMPIKKNSKENTSIQLTKPVQTTLQSLDEHNLLKIKNPASLLISGNENQVSNLESGENSLNLMESTLKSIKSLPVRREFIKIDPHLESVKYDKHLSTSEIESLLTNEIDSPVKNEDTIESNLTDQNEISNQGYNSISCKSLISLTECTDSSEGKSVERNSSLINNKCLGVNPLFNNENVSLDRKNISLISGICQSDDEQLKVDTIMKKNCKEAAQVVQCLIQNVVNQELKSNKLENGTDESIIGDENYLLLNNKDQTGIEFCHDRGLYKEDKDLSIRNSVDSKFNDSEDKDEDMKSTEESSSTDSNSHLMDLIGDAPIDNMSGSNEDISQTQYLNHESGKLERLTEENNEIKDEKFSISQSRNPSLYNKTLNIYSNYESINSSKTKVIKIDESPEERANKESILGALGLQSLKTVNEETNKPKRSSDNYTGTLKAVIKLNRNTDKKYGGHKMIFKQGEINNEASGSGGDRLEYRICSELDPSTEGVPLTHLGDIASLKKSSLKSSRPQFDMNSSQNIVGAQVTANVDSNKMITEAKDGSSVKESNLVIPEKSSSFSIHPGRLCSDVCTYCFGKFGSLDTPCHLAQFKNAERLNKILSTETHLAVDSCLCDGCFRYVDRKANCPTSKSHSRKPGQRRGPLSGTNCSVQGCTQAARHSVRRKWLIKLKKSISKKLIIDLDKNPNMPFPLCSQHYYWVDYFTVCGICKKRLTRNHMFALGLEADELNVILGEDRIPVRVSDKLFLCKMCHYYSALRQKYRDISQMSASNKHYFQQLKKKILSYHDVPLSDSEEDRKSNNEEDNKLSLQISKSKKKKSKSKSIDGQDAKKRNEDENSSGKSEKLTDQMVDYSYLESLGMTQEKSETPTVDYRSLESYEEQDCSVGFSNIASLLNPLDGGQGTVFPSTENQSRSRVDVKPTRIQVKFGNLNIGKLSNLNIGQDSRQGTADRPQYLPGERDLKLSSEFDFHGLSTPNVNWERCTSTIQFDSETKKLWQELQRPYGNQSSFLRHLLILEKHWRAGSLVYSEKPDPRAVKYITSVQNRVQAYEGGGCSSQKVNISPPSPVIQLNVSSPVVRPTPVSTPTCITASSPGLMKMQQVSAKDQPQKISNNMTFSLPTTQIVRPVDIQRLPVANKTVAVGPRPRKSNVKTASVGRGLGSGSPGSITFQQFKRLQIQRAMIQNEKERTAQSKNIAQASTSNRPDPCPSPASNFVPLISDVRSLATSNKTWKESFNQSFNKGFPPQSRYTPILPKIPKALTVTQIVQPSTSSVLLHSTSLTIEKATNPSTKPATVLCPEKPSISVFREPTPNGNA